MTKIFQTTAFFALGFLLAGKANAQLVSDKPASTATVAIKATTVANRVSADTKLASEVSVKPTQAFNTKAATGQLNEQLLSNSAKLQLESKQNLQRASHVKSLENKTAVDPQIPKQKPVFLKSKTKVKNQ